MEPFSSSTLTIIVLIAVILAGVTFIAISILIICLLRAKRKRSNVVSPTDSRSTASSASSDSRPSSVSSSSSSSITPIPIKSPKVISTKRKEQQSRTDSSSIITERPKDSQKKHQPLHRYEKNDETTIRNESRVYTQRHQQRQPPQQQPFKKMIDLQFIDRQTPYPPDVLERERVMMTHIRFPKDYKHNQ